MFDLESLPDWLVHTQFRISTTTGNPLPAGARRRGIIDLAGLNLTERSTIPAAVSLILSADMSPVSGIVLRLLDMRTRNEPALPNDFGVRYDQHRQLHLEIENLSAAPVAFQNAQVTVVAVPLATAPEGYVRESNAPALGASTTAELVARSLSGVELPQQWSALLESHPTLVSLASHDVAFSASDASYRIGVDFSGAGQFVDNMYQTQLTCSDARVVIAEQQNGKLPGKCFWTLYVPAAVPVGTYSVTGKLSGYVGGNVWDGLPDPIDGTWDAISLVS